MFNRFLSLHIYFAVANNENRYTLSRRDAVLGIAVRVRRHYELNATGGEKGSQSTSPGDYGSVHATKEICRIRRESVGVLAVPSCTGSSS